MKFGHDNIFPILSGVMFFYMINRPVRVNGKVKSF